MTLVSGRRNLIIAALAISFSTDASAALLQVSDWDICRRTSTVAECFRRLISGQLHTPGTTFRPAVYFDSEQATLTPDARAFLDEVAAAYSEVGTAAPSIVLSGHADQSGSAAFNLDLSQRRADAVRDYLVARGVPATALSTEAFGEHHSVTQIVPSARELLDRRVEFSVGPGGH